LFSGGYVAVSGWVLFFELGVVQVEGFAVLFVNKKRVVFENLSNLE
jgi:hypothetical protein